ncbi:N-acetylglutamate synthase, CG3035 family [Nocardia donostiensis]|uniref:GNAT family N-acetyltransferase n=1 Tax=Nocardia donostiensis TaxID=1538463 RepID=A0A1W0BNZ9_9NOCA|nr:GNAT family N-acetyltransferase [Nocardia donostiensis]ONM47605.1 GNAT family N-acetyltransferase [Nocardia donostiensis]OQS15050.1 GNAT family N-acetyltransferase [Nocardia donostiensis]OQS24223.1 GNAT family N-acetyltransferase [Nocardia donostiensis]
MTEPAAPGTPGGLPGIEVGRRVVLRYRLPEGYAQPLTDVIGELVSLEPVTVRTADGRTVSVTADRVVALKALAARPIRTGEIRALEAAAAAGWPGTEHAWIDGWLARAGHGYTRRANSAVPLGDADGPPQFTVDTLHRINTWYTQRNLPPRLLLPDRLASVPPGWNSWGETAVLGMDLDNFVFPQGPPMVRIAQEPSDTWLRMHRFRGEEPPDHTEPTPPVPVPEVLTAVRDGAVGFASLGLPEPIAIARGALTTAPDDRHWIGLSCVTVAAQHRRHGLAALVCAELLRWGRDRGATHAYVQVEADNAGALALYRQLGFVDHHSYRYAVPGGPIPVVR